MITFRRGVGSDSRVVHSPNRRSGAERWSIEPEHSVRERRQSVYRAAATMSQSHSGCATSTILIGAKKLVM